LVLVTLAQTDASLRGEMTRIQAAVAAEPVKQAKINQHLELLVPAEMEDFMEIVLAVLLVKMVGLLVAVAVAPGASLLAVAVAAEWVEAALETLLQEMEQAPALVE
jgi:hypothetical protein